GAPGSHAATRQQLRRNLGRHPPAHAPGDLVREPRRCRRCARELVRAAAIAGVVVVLGGATQVPHLGRCALFPANNPWNIRVDSLPVAPNSQAIVATIGTGAGLHPDFGSGTWAGGPIGIPFNLVRRTQQRSKVAFQYAAESDPGPYPIARNVKLEYGSDRHALIVDTGRCRLDEVFARAKGGGGGAG